jgi:hypothetical protein
MLECGVYRSPNGYEVRAFYDDDVLYAHAESSVEAARAVARDLRSAVIASGSFVELERADAT